MQGRRSLAAVIMLEHGVSTMMLARVLGVGDSHVFRYTNGHRRLSPVMMSKIRREFPTIADELIAACAAARVLRTAEPARIVRVRAPKRLGQPVARAADPDWDGQLYTIEEWRRLFGAPGSSQGASGRVEGFFPTEPCFLGE
jgi:plasmid maintenance system antidote protein VapI